MAEKLSHYLASINLSAVACEKGNALGEGTDVRVFDIQHIKGLEFEAVFFADVDKLAIDNPSLFDRFLYVGATRAATYLGLVCNGELPEKLQTLRASFDTSW
ncbi:MAG: ATP-binding domain-containing protein [Chitinophagales bacterium]|nr:ATP-binding domain-containing protein [Chitinophagales bacterium]